MLDLNTCRTITEDVEKLCTSGKDELDKDGFKKLALSAGQSPELLKFCYERLMRQLEKSHAEIRLGAFLVIDALFRKSEYFRELLLENFQTFLELTVESDPCKPLPPPVIAAKKLKTKTLQAVQNWKSKYGNLNRLVLAYNFIKYNMKVDFADALKRNRQELEAETARQEVKAKQLRDRVNIVKSEMDEHVDEISRIITESNNCFSLLIPKPEDLYRTEKDVSSPSNASQFEPREHGLTGPLSSITIELSKGMSKIERTEDNAPIIDSMTEYCSLLKNVYLPKIKKWVDIVSKSDERDVFRKALDLKEMVAAEIARFEEIELLDKKSKQDQDSDSDSDFEEVPEKPDFEAEAIAPPALPVPAAVPGSSKSILKPSANNKEESNDPTSWNLWQAKEEEISDPTSYMATLHKLKQKCSSSSATATSTAPSSSNSAALKKSTSCDEDSNVEKDSDQLRKEKLLQIAPKVPYDVDLYHWEDEDLKAPTVEIVEMDSHKFWQPSQDREGESIEAPGGVAALRTRIIEFSGTFEPVKWSCRAPLPSGALCPRKDRVKCPFHGKVIARNELGEPVRPEDIEMLKAQKEKEDAEKPPDWQDPQLLKDIQAEIGIDLTIKQGKKGRKKKSFSELYPGLTDIKKLKQTPRARIHKKIFNKRSLQRVADTLDSINETKFDDKFGDQWNYSMNND